MARDKIAISDSLTAEKINSISQGTEFSTLMKNTQKKQEQGEWEKVNYEGFLQ